jgi:SpoVK/Ycf46/Vps4 family AAA+-type ATPase
MALEPPIREKIHRVLLEQRQRERIHEHGFAPLRKLLFVGPPGTGKTMTAAAVAGELGLPLLTIQLDGLITKYLGETAAKLRLIFDAVQQTRGVYLFDEFDALGTKRTAVNEVGEIRRVLNSFLLFLEQDTSDSILVAATNYPKLLDHALFRRFDSVIAYSLPTRELTESLIRTRLRLLDTSEIDWNAVLSTADGLSHADVTRACESAAKKALLSHRIRLTSSDLREALQERTIPSG